MLGFVIRRLWAMIVQLVGILVVVFFVMRALPADPVGNLIRLNATATARAQVEHRLGLDQPVLTQFRNYTGLFPEPGKSGLLQGNFGTSWIDGSPIRSQIIDHLPVTLELVTYSLIIGCMIALPLGLVAALRPMGMVDRISLAFSLFAGAQPPFWWGLVFIYFFYFRLPIFPAPIGRLDPIASPPPHITGAYTIDSLLSGQWDTFTSAVAHLLLPVITLSLLVSAPIMKMVRYNMIDAMNSDFVLIGRANGLAERTILMQAARNALAPTLTLISILYGFLIGGAVLIEQVFSLGGIGQYAVTSVLALDYPAVQGVVLVIAGIFLLVYLALDVLHAVIDPRLRRPERRG